MRSFDEAGNMLEELGPVLITRSECAVYQTGWTQAASMVEVCFEFGSDLAFDEVTYSKGIGSIQLSVDAPQSPTFQSSQIISGMVGTGVVQPGQAPPPLVAFLTVTKGRQGATLDIGILGDNADFQPGLVQVTFGSGITVNDLAIQSPTEVNANITVAADAPIGPRAVAVSSGRQEAIAANAFNVLPGLGSVSGRLVDAGGQPLVGAQVCIGGTTTCTTTDNSGSFSLFDVPTTATRLAVSAVGFEPVSIPLAVSVGGSASIEPVTVASMDVPPPPPPPPGGPDLPPELASVLGRNLGDPLGGVTSIAQVQRTIVDAILAVGGTEAGVLDENGNQMNPNVEGAGEISLTHEGTRLIAQKIDQGESISLGEILFGFSFGLEWSAGEPLSLQEWLEGMQSLVDAAWATPSEPDNLLPILMFNRGRTLSLQPPVLSPDTRLNAAQEYLLVSSLWTAIATPESPQANSGSLTNAIGVALADLTSHLPSVVAVAHAQSSGASRPYTRFWRNFFIAKANFLTTTLNLAASEYFLAIAKLSMPTFSLLEVVDRLPAVGTAAMSLRNAFATIGRTQSLPSPPTIIGAKERPAAADGASDPVVVVTFKRSTKDDGQYVYSLYRFRTSDAPRELVASCYPGSCVSDADQNLVLTDTAPRPPDVPASAVVTQFYTMTATRPSSIGGTVPESVLETATPWWETGLFGPVSSFYGSTNAVVSDYSNPWVVSVGARESQAAFKEIEVDPTTGLMFLSAHVTPQGEERPVWAIYSEDVITGQLEPWVEKTFDEPGQKGLAIDSQGRLYTDVASTDAEFGGMIVRFSQPSGDRAFVGRVNYYSQILGFAYPVSVGPMVVGPKPEEDLFIVDELSRQVRRLQVNEPGQRAGAPSYAEIPSGGAAVDLAADGRGDLYLLLDRAPRPRIRITADRGEVWGNGHETITLTVQVAGATGPPAPGTAIKVTSDAPEDVDVVFSTADNPAGACEGSCSSTTGTTDVTGKARFRLSGDYLGPVTVTARTSVAGEALTASAQLRFVARRVAVFVQGINTFLPPRNEPAVFTAIRRRLVDAGFRRPSEGPPEGAVGIAGSQCANAIDDDGDGIANDGCPLILDYSYSGGTVNAETGVWRPTDYDCSDTKQDLQLSVERLRALVRDFAEANPNSRFVIVGHSQGGLLALHTIELVTPPGNTPAVKIDAVITLDGALGGAPRFEDWVAGLRCWGDPAATGMCVLWASVCGTTFPCTSGIPIPTLCLLDGDHEQQGSRARFFESPDNSELVREAQFRGTKVMTIGTVDDCVWNPLECGLPSSINNVSSQIIELADGLDLLKDRHGNCRGLGCVTPSHWMVLTDPEVLDRIRQYVGNPTEP